MRTDVSFYFALTEVKTPENQKIRISENQNFNQKTAQPEKPKELINKNLIERFFERNKKPSAETFEFQIPRTRNRKELKHVDI